jgi:hypothetical protein
MRPLHKHVRFVDDGCTRYLDGRLQRFDDAFQLDTPTKTRRLCFCVKTKCPFYPSLRAVFVPWKGWHPVLVSVLEGDLLNFNSRWGASFGDLFDYDYPAMRTANAVFRGELLAHVMHPDNVKGLCGIGLID